jgi:hypothetical protein
LVRVGAFLDCVKFEIALRRRMGRAPSSASAKAKTPFGKARKTAEGGKPRARGKAKVDAPAPIGTELALGSSDLRVAALLRQREQLLRKIAAKDRERARLLKASEELSHALQMELPPILRRQLMIGEQLQQLFKAILETRLSRAARRSVREVYASLQREGLIPRSDGPRDDTDDDEESGPGARGREWGDDDDAPQHPSAGHGGAWATEAESDDAVPSGDALRTTFRRVAARVHPDRVQSEAEKRTRTELMKELTRAYEAGDLARLLEIEESFSGSNSTLNSEVAWSDARLTGLERVVLDLTAQLRGLTTKVRALRRDSPLEELTGVRPRSRAHQAELLAEFVERARAELHLAENTLSFVQSFASGQISLAQFLAGPVARGRTREADMDDLLDALLGDLEAVHGARQARRGGSARGRGAKQR